jgi:tricorn protease-like protein
LLIRIFNTSTGKLIKVIEGHKTSVLCVDYSNDGKYIAAGDWDNVVKIWDVATGKLIKNLDDNSNRINFVKFSNDGLKLASAAEDGTIAIWNTTNWKISKLIKYHKNTVSKIAFSADSRYIASASWDNTVGLFDATSGSLIYNFKGHLSGVNTVAFSSDGFYLASGSDDRSVNVWNVKERQLVRSFNRRDDKAVYSLCFNTVNNFVVSGNENSSIDIWDVKKMRYKTSLNEHKAKVISVIFNNDVMASISDDKTIILWDMSDLKYEQCYEEKMKEYSYLTKPKDEFETTEQYKSRLEQFEKVKEGLRTECEIEFTSARQKLIKGNYSWVNLTVQNLSMYNADKQEYQITVDDKRYPLEMPISDARTFKETWNRAKVRGIKIENPDTKRIMYINLFVIHPQSKINYYFGNQVTPDEDPHLREFLKKYPK